jgi:hypothetical protein
MGGSIYFHQGFREFSPWLLGPMHLSRASWWQESVGEEVLYLMAAGKHKERKEEAMDKIPQGTFAQ